MLFGTKKERKKYCNLFEEYFRTKLNISIEDEVNFDLKLIENISKEYKSINQNFRNNGDHKFIIREKISLECRIDSFNKTSGNFNYNPVIITAFISIIIFGLSTMYQTGSAYIMKIADNKLKNVTDAKIIDSVNNLLNKLSNETIDSISSTILRTLVAVGVLVLIYELREDKKIKDKANKLLFYKLCYETLCKIETGEL